MTDYLFEPLPRPYLEIRDSKQVFPVHRVYCVGRNYAAHAMIRDPQRRRRDDRDRPALGRVRPPGAGGLVVAGTDTSVKPTEVVVHQGAIGLRLVGGTNDELVLLKAP